MLCKQLFRFICINSCYSSQIIGPVSYQVETENGIVIGRHVDHLRSRCTYSKELQNEEKDQDNFDDSPILRHTQNFTPLTRIPPKV